MNQYEIDHIGGIIEKPLPLQSGADLFNHLYKEMKEEAKINKKDVAESYLRSIIQNTYGAVHFIFKVKLNITAKQLKLKNEKAKKTDPDIKNLIYLDKKEYLNYLENCQISVKKVMVKVIDF